MSRLNFQLEATARNSAARAGRFHTAHGEILTPRFMPVGTQGAVRSQTWDMMQEVGASIVLANTYHLHLRPGPEDLRKLGGLHRLMSWEGALLTDSGGFQIFSLPEERQLTEAGARFRSRIDGREVMLSPEVSIATQVAIGSDIMMALDQCIPSTAPHALTREAMELTHRWAKRSLDARSIEEAKGRKAGALFGIVQGACHPELRRESAAAISALAFDGYAIGGLAVGETRSEREAMTELTAAMLPIDRPRYLMGVGTPIDLLEAVHRGVDLFDCILPTQVAQRGTAYTSQGPRQLRRGAYQLCEEPIDAKCACSTCRRYSSAYLHHLIKCDETLGWTLIAHHNLHFYMQLMKEARERILDGTFASFYRENRERLTGGDEENPVQKPRVGRIAKSRRMELGAFRVVDSPAGHSSIEHIASGEVTHSVNDPREEARRLYLDQSELMARLAEPGPDLVVWDAGLGSAFNAMECIHAIEATNAGGLRRGLHLVSFEHDLDALRLSLWHPERFAHLRHAAPDALLRHGKWQNESGSIRWDLITGDFRETLSSAPVPDIVFYDLYSAKTYGDLWQRNHFQKMHQHFMGSRTTQIYTYSASTAVRSALLLAGFHVGEGLSTGPKPSTTIASTHATLRHPLGQAWLARWSRSRAPFSADIPAEQFPALRLQVLAHAQFQSLDPP